MVGAIGAPGALDAEENPTTNLDVHTALVLPGDKTYPEGVSADAVKSLRKGEVLLVYWIDEAWITAPNRVFPVILDPSVCIQPGGTQGGVTCSGGFVETYIMSGRFPPRT